MVENDKENYLNALGSGGPTLALASMTQRFEAMPGNNPTRIPSLSIEFFRAPYTGWYKAHFSCQSSKQEVTTTRPDDSIAGTIIRDGYYFVITCKRSGRSPAPTKYDEVTGESLYNIQVAPSSPYIGNVIARASFVASGISAPSQACGYTWLERGATVGWHIYTYVSNNNYDLMGGDLRQFGRIIMNDISPSDTRMGYGSPRLYTFGSGGSTPGTSSDTVVSGKTISAVATPNQNPLRKSFLMIQFMGTGGMAGTKYNPNLETQFNDFNTADNLNAVNEVY
jgi:hypothetical protein